MIVWFHYQHSQGRTIFNYRTRSFLKFLIIPLESKIRNHSQNHPLRANVTHTWDNSTRLHRSQVTILNHLFWLMMNLKCQSEGLKKVTTYHTVKPAHAVTSIKQSPVLKGHLFLVIIVIENLMWIDNTPLLRGKLY